MEIWEEKLKNDIYFISIISFLLFFTLCGIVAISRKFGIMKVLNFLRYVITFHWLFKFINFLKFKLNNPMKTFHESINNIVNNDVEIVNDILNNEIDKVDKSKPLEK